MMLSSWCRDPSSNGERSKGPMNGEGCGLRAEDRGVLSGDCPWCFAKGQKNVLRSYAINFKESITLCTSPQCLFPLVSGPLDNIHAVLSSAQDIKRCKRKSHLSESKDPDPSPKRWQEEESNVVSKVKCRPSNVDLGDCRVSAKSFGLSSHLFTNGHKEQKEIENADKNTCTEVSTATKGDPGLSDDAQIEDPVSSTQDETREVPPVDVAVQDLIEMVPTRSHLFWRNKNNLCWLDSLLVALVHFMTFREASCENVSLTDNLSGKNSTVKNLCATYKKSCASIKAKEQQCQGNVVRVPSVVLQKAEQELEALRMSAFQLLQPKLQCELGQKETPVFALPLLLRSDDWANSLFQHTGQWEFRCTSCGYNLNTSTEKTVTTFTQIMADWHPLRAVHRAQCSNCHCKNQKRKLVLQRISSVLALHFVEGLPRRDVSKYSFDFQGKHYSIRTVIQYNEQLEHFVTWIHQPDGPWLEFDDLKYPHCITYKRFTLPASQFHLVFWEADSRNDSQLPNPLPDENTPTLERGKEGDGFQDVVNSVPDDMCIIEALTVNEDKNEAVSTLDSSIGSTTLLETFEGLSHTDIVTLTLVEVKMDAEGNAFPNSQETVAAESNITEASSLPEKSPFRRSPCLEKRKINCAKKVSSTPEIILSSVVKTSAAIDAPQVGQCSPALHSSNPTALNPSFLFQRHTAHQSTPFKVPLRATQPKPDLQCEGNEALPAKPAELFGGYRAKNSPNPVLLGRLSRHPLVKLPTVPQKPFTRPGGIIAPVQASTLQKSAGQNTPNSSPSKMALSTTDALRLKLLKKLKAKKKKLAKLNQLLKKGESKFTPRPDSTDVSSPYSDTSSTSAYDSPAYDHFFAELLSPAMSASNLSPDSTGLLEMLTNSQGTGTSESSPQENSALVKSDLLASMLPDPPLNDPSSTNDDFLDEFISGSREQQSEIESTDFNALDIFF